MTAMGVPTYTHCHAAKYFHPWCISFAVYIAPTVGNIKCIEVCEVGKIIANPSPQSAIPFVQLNLNRFFDVYLL